MYKKLCKCFGNTRYDLSLQNLRMKIKFYTNNHTQIRHDAKRYEIFDANTKTKI